MALDQHETFEFLRRRVYDELEPELAAVRIERDSAQASLLRVVEALKPFVVAFVRVAPKGVAHSDAGDNIMETLMVPRGACLTARTALSPHKET